MQWQKRLPLKPDNTFHSLSGQDWGIRVRGAESWKKFLSEMADSIGPDSYFMQEMGTLTIEMMRERTAAGLDYHGKAMAGYTEAYKKLKKRLGMGPVVNMRLFGDMYRNLTYRVLPVPNGIALRLFFQGTLNDLKAWVHQTGAISWRRKGRFHQKVREHMGFTDRNLQDIENRVTDALAEFLGNYN